MEDDYFELSPEESKKLDQMGITYQWRDSCLEYLKAVKLCHEEHSLLQRYYCRAQSKEWAQCQIKRERRICAQPNLKPAMPTPVVLKPPELERKQI
jgi:hypothetical protein